MIIFFGFFQLDLNNVCYVINCASYTMENVIENSHALGGFLFWECNFYSTFNILPRNEKRFYTYLYRCKMNKCG